MHVMTRCENQGIVIDNDITVTVLSVREDHVRLAIYSPRHTPVYREADLYCPTTHPWMPKRVLAQASGEL
ncbi:MAG: carbon storage regulator [Planctomycetales bacterium]